MTLRKRPWDLWIAIGILLLMVGQQAYLWYQVVSVASRLAVDPVFIAWRVGVSVVFAVLAYGLHLREAWSWWIAVVGLSILVLWWVYDISAFLRKGPAMETFGLGVFLQIVLSPLPLVTVVVLLLICRFRGAYFRSPRHSMTEV